MHSINACYIPMHVIFQQRQEQKLYQLLSSYSMPCSHTEAYSISAAQLYSIGGLTTPIKVLYSNTNVTLRVITKIKVLYSNTQYSTSKGSTYRMKLQIFGLPYTDVCLLLGISIPRVKPYSCLSQNILICSQHMPRSHTEAYDANMLSCIYF